MLLFASAAFASGLPWECPPITTPEDADVYRDEDGGLNGVFRGLYAAAYAYVGSGCVWTTTDATEPGSYSSSIGAAAWVAFLPLALRRRRR